MNFAVVLLMDKRNIFFATTNFFMFSTLMRRIKRLYNNLSLKNDKYIKSDSNPRRKKDNIKDI